MDSPQPAAPSSSSTTASEGASLREKQNCHVSQIGDDILEHIFSKLPAKSFAYAACVTRSWNSICRRFLSRPKLASALSLNSSTSEAINEVVEKVLSEPIRPNFAILYVNHGLKLEDAHVLLCKKLGRIPIIACDAAGIIGKDVLTGEIKEVLVENTDYGDGMLQEENGGIMLTIGYLPGMKVKLVTLMQDKAGLLIDRFALDIREFSASVSASSSPEAVIIFGNPKCDMKSVLFTLDHAFSRETIIVGNESAHFASRNSNTYAAAVVFARDKSKPNGLGEIKFHYALSSGTVDVGETYKAVSVKTRKVEHSTWLTAKVEGTDAILDGREILDGIPQMGSDLYIGVRKKRRCYMIESEKVKSVIFTEFHPIMSDHISLVYSRYSIKWHTGDKSSDHMSVFACSGDEEYLYVYGHGIKTGDVFRICTPDVDEALTSSASVSQSFHKLAKDLESDGGKEELFGAFIFSCCGRGESLFGKPNIESSPVLDNFPGVAVSGMFCGGEVGRGPLDSPTNSRVHVYSAVYMLLSYKP